jgi:hypothetical protein
VATTSVDVADHVRLQADPLSATADESPIGRVLKSGLGLGGFPTGSIDSIGTFLPETDKRVT